MNKNDWKLIIAVIVISVPFIVFMLLNNELGKKAVVYYESKEILTIDLTNKEQRKYQVQGYNGEISLETKDGQIRVINENSPLHLCSKQSWISHNYETIICLPNKIVIEIQEVDRVDSVVR